MEKTVTAMNKLKQLRSKSHWRTRRERQDTGKEALDQPAPRVAAQASPVLRGWLAPVGSVWRDHLDAVSTQLFVERIAVIGAISNQIRWLGFDHVEVEAQLCTRRTSWWLAAWVLAASGKPWRSTIAMIFMPFPRFVVPTCAPPPFAITNVASMRSNSGSLAIFTAIRGASSGFDSNQSSNLPMCFKWRGGERASEVWQENLQ
jgi:hypothetical protein